MNSYKENQSYTLLTVCTVLKLFTELLKHFLFSFFLSIFFLLFPFVPVEMSSSLGFYIIFIGVGRRCDSPGPGPRVEDERMCGARF